MAHGAVTWENFTNSDLSVDFVLAYDQVGKPVDVEKRHTFEKNLENAGLILEREETRKLHFVKIHVPTDVLCQYAEVLKLRFPIKNDGDRSPEDDAVVSVVSKLLNACRITVDPKKFNVKKFQLTAEYSRDKEYLFDTHSPDFFDVSSKHTIISYILERESFGEQDQDKGIKKMIAEGIYKAAYPLHDGDLNEEGSKRKLLLDEWASVSKCMKFQPIDEIKDYFGVKFALYFAWLGFYTNMLIPAAVVGICCIIYAAGTLSSDRISEDICTLDITMCPRCDRFCDYWKLSEGCLYSKIQHFVDNSATIFFAVFMSIWGAVYLELWKRYSAEIAHRWGLTGFDLEAEPPRPEYLLKLSTAKKKKLNVVTQLEEPVAPFCKVRLPSIVFSFAIAFLWAFIALCVVFGVVIYRIALVTSDALYEDEASYRIYVIPVTAALINLVCISLLNIVYNRLAVWLTEMELQRTQTEFDESLALKIYMFQFANYYSSILYIAFFKGKFVGYPSKYNKILGYRQEECNPGGCLMELTIQLAIVMIGKQALNAVTEMGTPLLIKAYRTFVVTTGIEKAEEEQDATSTRNQWAEDYKLADVDSSSLFPEYMEMVLQYGFVTLFVTAFPLAPIFALINNVLEMRLDAKKFLVYYKRPVPQRVKNIGVWMPILAIVGRLAVVSNAFIIAFSSNFIPKLVYELIVNSDHTDEGFLEFTLAYFDTSDFNPGTAPESPSVNVSICRYAEYRNPPEDPMKYKRPVIYWHILTARLAFIVAYQNLVSLIMIAVDYLIPDVSRKLNDRIKEEAYKVNETIIKREKEIAKYKPKVDLWKRAPAISEYRDRIEDFQSNGSKIYVDSGINNG